MRHLSTAGHEKPVGNRVDHDPRLNTRQLPIVNKYREGKVKRTPAKGSEIEPETVNRQDVTARKGSSVPFVE